MNGIGGLGSNPVVPPTIAQVPSANGVAGTQQPSSDQLNPTVAASAVITPAQSARNKALAQQIAAGSVEDARKVIAANKPEIDGFSDPVKADLKKQVHAETAARAVTDKGFMEKYGSAILLLVEAALSNFHSRGGASAWWAKAGPEAAKLFANNPPDSNLANLIT
jgi:hypothetical protein